MKIIFLSDFHLVFSNPVCRVDNLTKTQFEKLKWVFERWQYYGGKEEECIICQAGDFFNAPRSYSLMFATLLLFSKYNPIFYSIRGQHDTLYRDRDVGSMTNFNTLVNAGFIRVLGADPAPIAPMVDLYGCQYGEEIPKVEDKSIQNILVIHKEISDTKLPGVDYVDAKGFLKHHKDFQIILCGDIHRKFMIQDRKGRIICNTGPMLRTTADIYNISHTPCIFVYDTKTMRITEEKYPRALDGELVISRSHLERNETFSLEDSEVLKEFIESMKNASTKKIDVNENIYIILKSLDDDLLTRLVEEIIYEH